LRQFARTGLAMTKKQTDGPQQNEQVALGAPTASYSDDAHKASALQQPTSIVGGQQRAGLKHQYPGRNITESGGSTPKQRRRGRRQSKCALTAISRDGAPSARNTQRPSDASYGWAAPRTPAGALERLDRAVRAAIECRSCDQHKSTIHIRRSTASFHCEAS